MIYLFAIILLTIGFWNVYVILWKTDKQRTKLWSKVWHAIGLLLRIEIWAAILLYFLLNGWQWKPVIEFTLVFIAVGGVLYDFIINAVRYIHTGKPSIWYVDNKGWNAVFLKFLSPKVYWIIRIIVAIAGLLALIFI